MNPILGLLLAIVVAGLAFLLVSALLFWLVPLAFLVSVSFTQAMAGAGLLLLVTGLLAPKG